jgi:methyl-accepting chemotaxis protein
MNADIPKPALQKRKTSIKRQVALFSAILFVAILIGGSIAFAAAMWQLTHVSTGQELIKSVEIERIKLEASVNAEIAIALKMADSPIIQSYFVNPGNPELERLAFAEIAGYRRAFSSNSVFWVNDIDKMFYQDDAYSYTIDPTNPNDYWYLMTLNQAEAYNFNINYNPALNKTNLWINAPVYDSRHRPIGMLGTGIVLTDFVDSIYREYTGAGELYFFNSDNEITGARNSTLVANKAILDNELGAAGTEILATAKDLKPGEFHYFNMAGIGEIAVGEVPALRWYITAIQPITLLDALNNTMSVIFLAVMAVIAIIFVVFFLFITGLLKPLNEMVQTLNKISTDWDLTRQLQLKRRDEMGTLGEFFNLTFERMKGLLVGIRRKTIALFDTGDELTANMTETTIDVDKINDSIQDMMRQVLSQSDKVNTTAGTMDNIITGLNELNDHIRVQADSVARSSSAIEEMLANIQSVTQTLVKNAANINSLAESSKEGRIGLQKVSEDIQEIARESEGLLEINSVMQTIASQTNLLSMNAAIEAAHAGESGKGFAVVAGEIRKLAENSSNQSKTISAVLKKIKASIDAITVSNGNVLERFETIEQEVQTVTDQETHIRNAMEEQGIGSRQILEALTQLNSVTNLVQSSSSEMAEKSNEVLKESSDLKHITNEVADKMDQMTQSALHISDVVLRVKEIGEENKLNIDSVSEEVSRFKVE